MKHLHDAPLQACPTKMPVVFHQFSSLPFDIRFLIWVEFLAEQRGRMHLFYMGARYILGPPNILDRYDKLYPSYTHDVALATRPSRTLSAVCREARHAMCTIFPDTLEFYLERPRQDSSVRLAESYSNSGILRFDASRDIITLDAHYWARQAAIGAIDPRDFNNSIAPGIKHLAISATSFFTALHFAYGYIDGCQTRCEGPECARGCERDNFPSFLRLFPDITHLYIADTKASEYKISRDGCFCNIGEPGPTLKSGPQIHTWPRIRGFECPEGHKSMPRWEWFAIRDEDSDCLFPLADEVHSLRITWKSINFPYYPEFSHLKIKFLQPLPIWRGPGAENDHLGEIMYISCQT